jgi:anti-sigma28 factor (negative regulator of flagellin synthesis)
MIISHDEIIKCMDIISVETSASPSAGMTPAARVYMEIFKERFKSVEPREHERVTRVKREIASNHYQIDSGDIAEKMLGRVISDKVR